MPSNILNGHLVRERSRPRVPVAAVVAVVAVPFHTVTDRPKAWAAGDWSADDGPSSEGILVHNFRASRLIFAADTSPLTISATFPRQESNSWRAFEPAPLNHDVLMPLLGALCATSEDSRPYPSAGALYPCHPFLVQPSSGEDTVSLSYVDGARRTCQIIGSIEAKALRGVLLEDWAWPAGCLIVLVVDFTRVASRYGDRGLRFALMEAGLLMGRILRQTESLGLCACAVGGFDDVAFARLLGLDPRWYGVALAISVGYAKESQLEPIGSPEAGK